MDILKILQAALDAFNDHRGHKLYYIEDGDLIFNGDPEPRVVCSVSWIDMVIVDRDSIIISSDIANEGPIELLTFGPEELGDENPW